MRARNGVPGPPMSETARPPPPPPPARALGAPRALRALPGATVSASSGQVLIVTELCDGADAAASARRRPVRDALLAEQLARAVAPAHARKYTHGDIKPQNVLLTREGEVKPPLGLGRAVGTLPATRTAAHGRGTAAHWRPSSSAPTTTTRTATMIGGDGGDGDGGGGGGGGGDSSDEGRRRRARGGGRGPSKRPADVHAQAMVLFAMLGGREPFAGRRSADRDGGVLARQAAR